MEFIPHDYQKKAIDMIRITPYCGLFLDMGLGKTVSTLVAVDSLLKAGQIHRALVIAPLNVARNTWSTETEKWDCTRHLTISKVLGTLKERTTALEAEADIYVINRENVKWLVDYTRQGKDWQWDCLVIDELSSFKSYRSQRFKALRTVRPLIKRVIGLTGTPAPNGLMDLWPQLYLLDRGERLGKTITQYRFRYFTPGRTNGMIVFNYNLKPGAASEIMHKIADICISMSAKDYLKLPKRVNNYIYIDLDTEARCIYDELEHNLALSVGTDEISVPNAAACVNKLLQICNGSVYDDEHLAHGVHTEKIKALADIMDEAQGASVLVFYSFQSDLMAIQRELKAYSPVKLTGEKEVREWNEGRIQMLLAHPASAGHGLNLQAGGHIIVWYGLNWSLELYQQANARLHRQGQTKPVIIHHILARDTYEDNVAQALADKDTTQGRLLAALKARLDKALRL